MALNQANLKSAIKSAFKSVQSEPNAGLAVDRLAGSLARAIHDFIKEGEVTALTGEVQVEGSPSKQTNLAPLKITGGIS